MSWQPVALAWPDSAADIATTADLGAVPGALAAAAARLASVTGTTFTANPLAGGAGGAAAARGALQALLDGPCWLLTVDPWSAGTGEHLHRHLSPINAVTALANQLRDSGDPRRPTGAVDLVAVLVYATTLPALAQQLAQLNAIVPLLEFAQRRAAQLADLETNKWLQPAPLGPLHWQQRPRVYQPSARATDQRLGAGLAALEAIAAENTTPVAELSALITKKAAAAAAIDDAVADLANQFGGGAGSGLFASGSSLSALAATLSAGAPADHGYTLTAGLCLVAPTGGLQFFRELFGL